MERGTVGKAEKVGEVTVEMEHLGREVEYLNKSLSELEERLKPVTQPTAPTEGMGKDAKMIVPLASEIRIQTDKVRRMSVSVKGIVDRLEI